MLSKLLFLLAYYPVLGVPAIAWISVLTFLVVGSGMAVALLNRKGIYAVPLKFHIIFGVAGTMLLFVQTILVLSVFMY